MSEIDTALIYEILRSIQKSQSEIKATLVDHTRQFVRIREELNGLRSDDLRREVLQAQMDSRLQRIEAHRDLTDAYFECRNHCRVSARTVTH